MFCFSYEDSPRLIELTYEASLKSYWRKSALRKFLLASHISSNFVAGWSEGESKREFLDRLFERLQAIDKGGVVISQMARNLSEQSSFPDLEKREDSIEMIRDAERAVRDLKLYLKQQNEEIKSEGDRLEAQKRARNEKERI